MSYYNHPQNIAQNGALSQSPLRRAITRVPLNNCPSLYSGNPALMPPPQTPTGSKFMVNQQYRVEGYVQRPEQFPLGNNTQRMPPIRGLDDKDYYKVGETVYVRRAYSESRFSSWMKAIIQRPQFEKDKRTGEDNDVRIYSVLIQDVSAPKKNNQQRTYCPGKGEMRAVPKGDLKGANVPLLFPLRRSGSSLVVWTPATVIDLGASNGYLVAISATREKGKVFDNVERYMPLNANSVRYLTQKRESLDIEAVREYGLCD